MKGTWVRQTGRFQNGEDYKLGPIKVGSAFYDGTVGINNPRKYANAILLPGVKTSRMNFFTIEEAKISLEQMVEAWFLVINNG